MPLSILDWFELLRPLAVVLALMGATPSGGDLSANELVPQTESEANFETAVSVARDVPKSDDKEEPSPQPEPLPESVIEAWTRPGSNPYAGVGWTGFDSDGNLVFLMDPVDSTDLPTLRVQRARRAGFLSNLPDPDMPFGLQFSNSNLMDEVLPDLAAYPSVELLNLDGRYVTDAGLPALAELPNLRVLHLGNTRITDAGMADLAELTQLEWLSLQNTPITDAGLQELAELTNLQSLYLEGTQVTDAGLTVFAEMESLRILDLYNTQVTDDGVAELQAALPECEIRLLRPEER